MCVVLLKIHHAGNIFTDPSPLRDTLTYQRGASVRPETTIRMHVQVCVCQKYVDHVILSEFAVLNSLGLRRYPVPPR